MQRRSFFAGLSQAGRAGRRLFLFPALAGMTVQTPSVAKDPSMPDPKLVAELAPTGVLRAAINMGNFLLVTGKAPNGDPTGVSPDMALAIGARLGVPVRFIPYARPGQIADDAEKGLWDIGNIGAEPQRAAVISFTAA